MNHQCFYSVLATAVLAAVLIPRIEAQTPGLHAVVAPYADAGRFMGSVLVAKRGEVLLNRGYGSANLEWAIPNSPTTRFQLASVTKQFTAAAILLLEDRGKLKSDDSVRKHLPSAPAVWEKITIYHLLTHTSGIVDDAVDYDAERAERLVLLDMPTAFAPGEKWAYSNVGYIVLGHLLEQVSGQRYGDFMRVNIFAPLGMNDSGLDSNVTVIERRATGYSPRRGGPVNAEKPDLARGFSAGSLYSTTEDLLRWERGLFGGKLLSPASLRKMTTPFKSDYACGVYVRRVNGRTVVEHDGDNIGFQTHLAYYPDEDLAVVVLGNMNTPVTKAIADGIAAMVDSR